MAFLVDIVDIQYNRYLWGYKVSTLFSAPPNIVTIILLQPRLAKWR